MQRVFKNEGRQIAKKDRQNKEYMSRYPAVGMYNPNFDAVKKND